MSNPILVIAEARSGQLKKASKEAVTAGKELAAAGGGDVIGLLIGNNLGEAAKDLATAGASKVICVEAEHLDKFSGDGHATAALEQIEKLSPTAILMPHTAMAKDMMPRIAASLKAGMISDATVLHFEDGKFGATKPVFAGKAYQKSFANSSPFVATVRPNSYEAKAEGEASVETTAPSIGAGDIKAMVQELVAAAGDRVPLQEAKVVVAGGRGLKGPEHFHLVEDLAEAFGPGVASVGASRAVVDSGWREHREQVGQTGKVVAPTLYIAVGISGAIQHLAGMQTSRFIVAINKDAEAPIFKVADYGIVGDAFEVLPALTEAVKAAAAH